MASCLCTRSEVLLGQLSSRNPVDYAYRIGLTLLEVDAHGFAQRLTAHNVYTISTEGLRKSWQQNDFNDKR